MNSLFSGEMPTEASWSMALDMAALLSSSEGAGISTKWMGPSNIAVVSVLKRGTSFFERASAAWLNCRRLCINLMGVRGPISLGLERRSINTFGDFRLGSVRSFRPVAGDL